jgi:hypothetical protein
VADVSQKPLIRPMAADSVDAQEVWGLASGKADTSLFSGEGVVVAVLDTGIDKTHAVLAGMADGIVQKDFTGTGDDDGEGHELATSTSLEASTRADADDQGRSRLRTRVRRRRSLGNESKTDVDPDFKTPFVAVVSVGALQTRRRVVRGPAFSYIFPEVSGPGVGTLSARLGRPAGAQRDEHSSSACRGCGGVMVGAEQQTGRGQIAPHGARRRFRSHRAHR